MAFERLREPIEFGGLAVRSRLVMPTHGPRLSRHRYLEYLATRARGGIGLAGLPAGFGVGDAPMVPGPVIGAYAGDYDAVRPDPLSLEGIAFHDERVIPMLRDQADVLRANGVVSVGQLHHGGANRNNDDFQPTVAPSAVVDGYARNVPHVLSVPEIERLAAVFAEGARRVREAGCDAVEIHAGHGYLVHQFLSPLTNLRDDEYGGSSERRRRFLGLVLDAVRDRVGSGYPIGVRLNAGDATPGGLETGDVVGTARWLEDQAIAYLNISGGTYTGWRDGVGLAYVAPAYVAPGPNVDGAAAVTSAVTIPVIATGRIIDLDQAEAILSAGKADLVGMVRALIAEPDLLGRGVRGLPHRPCIGTNECHYPGRPVTCAVNPAAGREEELALHPARSPRRVLVIGGGVAGMEAATVAAERGHDVVLHEERAFLGGAVADLAHDDDRREYAAHVAAATARLQDAGVECRLGSRFTASQLEDEPPPDVVVLATGATEYVPAVEGIHADHVSTARAVLRGDVELGGSVLVVGGLEDHLPPVVIADVLARRGLPVSLITELPDVGPGIEPATRFLLLQRLARAGVTTRTSTRLEGVEAGRVRLGHLLTSSVESTEADHVVLACGRRQNDGLAARIRNAGHEVHVIGDALAPRRIAHATLDAARVARVI